MCLLAVSSSPVDATECACAYNYENMPDVPDSDLVRACDQVEPNKGFCRSASMCR